MKQKEVTPKNNSKDTLVRLNMTYEEAMRKALSTPLPSKAEKKKRGK